VLRAIFGPKRREVTRRWGKWHNYDFHDSYSSSHMIRVVRSRRMGRAGHMACMGRKKCMQNFYRKTSGEERTWQMQALNERYY
jgi:hypothetical protein